MRIDAIGETTLGARSPMTRDTIFRVASLTKPIVAAAVMALVEEGTLKLDGPVDGLLPELAERCALRAGRIPPDRVYLRPRQRSTLLRAVMHDLVEVQSLARQ